MRLERRERPTKRPFDTPILFKKYAGKWEMGFGKIPPEKNRGA